MDLENSGIELSVWRKQRRDQLRSYCKADLRLSFCLCRLLVFPCGSSNFIALMISIQGSDISFNSNEVKSLEMLVKFNFLDKTKFLLFQKKNAFRRIHK